MNMKKGITRRELEVTDIDDIIAILDKSVVVHIAMVDGDEPYVVPMNYGYTMEDGKLTLYLHGATKGRKLEALKKNPKVFFSMECDVTAFEGNYACQYGVSYSSLMGSGTAELVEDMEEKKKALEILMKTQTGKDFKFEDRMAAVVSIIRIPVKEYTAKHRPIPKKSEE